MLTRTLTSWTHILYCVLWGFVVVVAASVLLVDTHWCWCFFAVVVTLILSSFFLLIRFDSVCGQNECVSVGLSKKKWCVVFFLCRFSFVFFLFNFAFDIYWIELWNLYTYTYKEKEMVRHYVDNLHDSFVWILHVN